MLAPAGGPPTIDFPLIPQLLDAIGPRLVLPMHYKTPKINLNIQPVERFLEVLPQDPIIRIGSSTFEVTSETLPETTHHHRARSRAVIAVPLSGGRLT